MLARVTSGVFVCQMHSFAPPRCKIYLCFSQYSLERCYNDPVFDGVGLAPINRQGLQFNFVSYYFLFFFHPRVGCVGLGFSDDNVFSISHRLAPLTYFEYEYIIIVQ